MTVLGVGGVAPPRSEEDYARWGWPDTGQWMTELELSHARAACLRLSRSGKRLDILMSHDGPTGMCLEGKPEVGAVDIERLIRLAKPRFAFFGHYDSPPRPRQIGETLVVPMCQPDLGIVENRTGCIGLLDTLSWKFRFLRRSGYGFRFEEALSAA